MTHILSLANEAQPDIASSLLFQPVAYFCFHPPGTGKGLKEQGQVPREVLSLRERDG